MAYSDIENDYNNDPYNDNFITLDEVINNLKGTDDILSIFGVDYFDE